MTYSSPALDEGIENSNYRAHAYGNTEPQEFLARIHLGGKLILERPGSVLGLKIIAGETQGIEDKIRIEKREGKGTYPGDCHALKFRRHTGLGPRGVYRWKRCWNRSRDEGFRQAWLRCLLSLQSPAGNQPRG